jgi:succinate dehydrogenase / fumarate reductase cytochrome b subunit
MLIPGRYGLERWSYVLQRVSGVVVSLYFIAHVLETGNFIGGITVWSVPEYSFAERAYEETVKLLKNPIFDVGLAVIGFLVGFHTINGIRLILAHFGFSLGRPKRPEPFTPPPSFSSKQRALFWLSISLAVFALLYTLDALTRVFRP